MLYKDINLTNNANNAIYSQEFKKILRHIQPLNHNQVAASNIQRLDRPSF